MCHAAQVSLILSTAILFSLTAGAATITVDVNGGGDYVNIRDAIAVANNGDTVLVYPGTYGVENTPINFHGRNIILLSRDGRDATIIDGEDVLAPDTVGFVFTEGELRAATVDGFTLANAYGGYGCAGLYCENSNPTFRNCRFTHCSATSVEHANDGSGGVGCIRSATPLFEDCMFDHNFANRCCGGLYVYYTSSPVFRRCVFSGNRDGIEGKGSVYVLSGSTATFEDCVLIDHVSHAESDLRSVIALAAGGQASFQNCTFANNAEGVNRLVRLGSNGVADMVQTICAFNECEAVFGEDGTASAEYSCFFETGTCQESKAESDTNLYVDPRFCGLTAGNFTLCADSPCLPSNNTWTLQIGAYDQGCPPCESPVERTSWGAVKSLYR